MWNPFKRSAAGTNWVTGAAEPHPLREPWPLRLERAEDGSVRLVLVTPGAVQAIFGIHQRLQPLLTSFPSGAELAYLCRVADGAHYNVRNLVAVELVDPQPGFAALVDALPEAFVASRPDLLAARAHQELDKGSVDAAVATLRRVFEVGPTAARIDPLWRRLPEPGRAQLLSDYVSWVASQPLEGPQQLHRLVVLPLPAWPMHALEAAANATQPGSAPPTFGELITFELVLAELERRGSSEVGRYRLREARRAEQQALADPAQLKGELLHRLLPAREPSAIAVYADVLSEVQHPYGEFVNLSLQRSAAAAKKAKALAAVYDQTWLGALWFHLTVQYELGLPTAGTFDHAFGDLQQACAHPLVPFFRKVLRKKTKKQRRMNLELHNDYLALVRAMLPHSLVELDCAEGTLEALGFSDLSKLTHLHDLDLTSTSVRDLRVERLPQVSWVGLRVEAGHCLQTFDLVQRDRSGLFGANTPHLDFFFVGGASSNELAQLTQAAPGFHGCALSLDGQAWPT